MKLNLKDKKLYFLIIGIILITDQISKFVIKSKFVEGESIRLIKSFFNLTYVKNDGAVWGLFSKQSNSIIPTIITVLALVTLIIISFFFLKLKNECKYELFGLAFVLGGAIGNIIDRISQGFVVDFFDFIIFKYHWPVFNVADSFISIGVFILVISVWKGKCPQF